MKKVLIKLGGSSLQSSATLEELSKLISGLQNQNNQIILVHGGGPRINQALESKNIKWQFINGQRQTTPEMMTVIEDVLAHQVNGEIVQLLSQNHLPVTGLSGADEILYCSQLNQELMQVGKIENVFTEKIQSTLNAGNIPVIAPIGYGSSNEKYNINADWAATQIAQALKVDQLIFLTDQEGILGHNKNLLHETTPHELENLIEDGTISGGMMTKVRTMISALDAGVSQVRVLLATKASELLMQPLMGSILVHAQTSSLLNHIAKESYGTH